MSMMSARVGFLIGGVQKAGTTALAKFLERNPALALPIRKEAHVFDAPDFDEDWSVEQVNQRYAPHFDQAAGGAELYGDATPVYVLHSRFIVRIARYNPAMRWVLILRHPVDRAVSHYHMERGRGAETWPLWPAMLLERWRLRGHGDDFSPRSPLRRFSYRTRGDYARQLDVLYKHFPPEQVLVLRNEELAHQPRQTLARVSAFLGVPDIESRGEYERVFEGGYTRIRQGSMSWRVLNWMMRREVAEAKRLHDVDWYQGDSVKAETNC